jgi:hypothetical protein
MAVEAVKNLNWKKSVYTTGRAVVTVLREFMSEVPNHQDENHLIWSSDETTYSL